MQASSRSLTVRDAETRDAALLLGLIGELAEYEHLSELVTGTEHDLAAALSGPAPAAEALIAERGGQTAGFALFFTTFSTFLCQSGLWLEDLFVRPAHRGAGVGRELMAQVARRAVQRGAGRLEWTALDWNEPALGFYSQLGARTMDDWITHRLEGEALRGVAAPSVSERRDAR